MGFFQNMVEAIVRSAGYPVPTDTDPKKLKNGSGFSQFLHGLSNNGANVAGMQVPTPPKPPENPADIDEQKKYNEALLTYNQQFQAYHTNVLKMLSYRFLMLQQALILAKRTQNAQNSNSNDTRLYGSAGIGGILGGDSGLL